jgi:hypothetical protein
MNTRRALCDLGASVTVHVSRLRARSVTAALAFYGLTPHPEFRIRSHSGGPIGSAIR